MSLPTLSFQVQAPGRICLFGEHGDYLGFPVVARAVPLFCSLQVQVVTIPVAACDIHSVVTIHLHVPPELGGHSKVYNVKSLPPSPPPSSPVNDDQPVDFALAAMHEVLREGWDLSHWCRSHLQHKENNDNIHVHCHSSSGDLPLQAGCSSSTAFLVAWVLMLAELAGKATELLQDPIRLAKLAWRAEVEHFGHPGGTMDHVSIALGTRTGKDHVDSCGALRIGPGQWQVERLPTLQPSSFDAKEPHDDGVWILADSGEPKDTLKHLKRCKRDRLQLLQDKLNNNWDCPQSSVANLSIDEARLWNATLVNRDTESEATSLWKESVSNHDDQSVGHKLANLMKKHHEALRDGLGLSTPRLEAMNEAALRHGAWGFKLVGSGGGGCGVAWAPTQKAEIVSKAMKEAGAKATWVFDSRQPVPGALIIMS
jgi:galactokinase